MSDLSVIILAAGQGTRMKSSIPKVLHKIAGREMLNLVIDTAKTLNPHDINIVISDEMVKITDKLKAAHSKIKINFAIQSKRLGTADAVRTALQHNQKIADKVLILYGDTPLLKTVTLQKMLQTLDSTQQNSLCVLGFDCFNENKYGRLIVNESRLERIVEFKDATDLEKAISLCNSGVLAIHGKDLTKLLDKIENNNNSGEYYLTDIVGIARSHGLNCSFIKTPETEVMGINSRIELAHAEKIRQNELRNYFMENGVTLIDPESIYFSYDTKIMNDTIIHPQVVIYPGVTIANGCEIKSFSHLEGVQISENVIIGPFARLRPDTIIKSNARIGNFVEIKKSTIESGAKINHLSYVGDSEIGEDSNIGAGTITCNYDGHRKFKTKIGKRVFIGSNTAMIAPVNIGDDAVIGAGSVITKDVASDDLGVSRAKQINLPQGGKKYHQTRKSD